MERKLYCEAPFDGLLNLCGQASPSVLDIKGYTLTRESYEAELEIVIDRSGPEG